MGNIVIGLIFLIGGLSGKIAIRGTDSSTGAAILGGALVIWGIVQLVRSKSQKE